MRSLSILVHGASKVGKSWMGDSTPAPRLILDAEGGSRFTPSKKVVWDPLTEEPPKASKEWDTCIVYVKDYETVLKAYEWLNQSNHPFKSVVLDSISEIQQRCVDSIAGVNAMRIQDWGELLRKISDSVRKFRDLTVHSKNPLESVLFIAMTRQVDNKWRPYMQGQIATTMPYYVDICGYLFMDTDDAGNVHRRLLVAPHQNFEAGERVGGKLGSVIESPSVEEMLNTVYGEKKEESE